LFRQECSKTPIVSEIIGVEAVSYDDSILNGSYMAQLVLGIRPLASFDALNGSNNMNLAMPSRKKDAMVTSM
jgi:pyruvate/oxaloacetate carboxyltransferase